MELSACWQLTPSNSSSCSIDAVDGVLIGCMKFPAELTISLSWEGVFPTDAMGGSLEYTGAR